MELGALIAEAWVPSLVRELRSHKPHGAAKNKKEYQAPGQADLSQLRARAKTTYRPAPWVYIA